ncbi:MAG: hypothetical protein ABSE50_23245 [Xanthobacteraceae bacterium]
MPKLIAAAVLASALALSMNPARSADSASPNDTARFLAGLPPASDSPLAALANMPAFTQQQHAFDSVFEQEDKNTLSKVRAFSAAHLSHSHDTMLYMFSGPDFLYASSFFPHASTYVFAGLEPVGDIPPLNGLPRGAVEQTLQNLRASTYTILHLSFFITKNMRSQLSEGPVFGTLPVLYVFLARTGKTLHEASFVSLDSEGNFVAPNDTNKHSDGEITHGLKIVFSDSSGPNQTLYYFSTDLSDGGVKRSGFLAFCAKLGTADSFVKSASYLMHSDGFGKVRSFLLDHSGTILQDDSGIPLAYFDRKKWDLQPFGHYFGALGLFPHTGQPEMAVLFRKATPLDFGIGYRWKQSESNLLLAERTADAQTASINPSLTTSADGTQGVAVGSPDTPSWAKMHPRVAASEPPRAAPAPRQDSQNRLFFPFWR